MKNQLKAIISISITICLLFGIGSLFFTNRTNCYSTDEQGNLIEFYDIPYYQYGDSCGGAFYVSAEEVPDSEVDKRCEKYLSTLYTPEDNKDYLVSDYKDGVCINRYLGDDTNIIIPEEIGGKKVIKIGVFLVKVDDEAALTKYTYINAFDYCKGIKSIYLPATVKEIVRDTFYLLDHDSFKSIKVSEKTHIIYRLEVFYSIKSHLKF